MGSNYRRITGSVLIFLLLLLVLLFISNNNTSSQEYSPVMDAEISVNKGTRESFASPIPALSLSKMRQFTGGRHLFRRSWTPAPSSVKSLDGLGPVFNRVSCSGCHVKDGRGRPPKEWCLNLDLWLLNLALIKIIAYYLTQIMAFNSMINPY